MRSFIKAIICLSIILFSVSAEARYGLDAVNVYRQARLKNYTFLEYISDYKNIIDVTNRFGDTALCMSIKYKDKEAAQLLIKYGANKNHRCVKRLQENYNQVAVTKNNVIKKDYSKAEVLESGDSNYLLWGGVGIAAVGGIALASGGGSGGGYVDDKNNGGNVGGDDKGDDNGGNVGGDDNGDDNGGNVGGDDNGDNNGGNNGGNVGGDDKGDDNGGNVGGDDNGGNNGGNNGGDDNGDNNGGNNGGNIGGDDNGDDIVKLYDVKASEFKTSEYNKGNFLNTIKAAEAYQYIYKKDENGNLVSHQANSDDPLEKVKVGVIDVGVYANNELKDKITTVYDANSYNNIKNVKVYVDGDVH